MEIIERGKTFIRAISNNGYNLFFTRRIATVNIFCENCEKKIFPGEDYYRMKCYSVKMLCCNCSPVKIEKARGNRQDGNFRYFEESKKDNFK